MNTQIYAGGRLLYDSQLPANSGYSLHEAKISERLNKAGSLSMTIPRDNCLYNGITPLRTLVEVFRDGAVRWRGRALVPGMDLYGRKKFACEGELCFLQDSVQRPRIITGTPAEVFADLIAGHNTKVEDWKRFAVDDVTVTTSTGLISLVVAPGQRTYALVADLIKEYGGFVLFDGPHIARRIGWYAQLPKTCSQPVRAGYNLVDLSSTGDVTSFATRIVPYGTEQEDGSRLTLDLDGADYIENAEAVAQYGVVEVPAIYPEATTQEELLAAAQADLVWRCVIPVTYNLTAADMAGQGLTVDRFAMGQRVRATSALHELLGTYDLLALEEDILDPLHGKVTLTRDAAYADTGIPTISGAVSDQQAQLNSSRITLPGGWMGYLTGSTGSMQTTGIGMVNERGECYQIVTWAGVRSQAGDHFLYIPVDKREVVTNARIVGYEGAPLELGDVNIVGTLMVNGVVIGEPAAKEETE